MVGAWPRLVSDSDFLGIPVNRCGVDEFANGRAGVGRAPVEQVMILLVLFRKGSARSALHFAAEEGGPAVVEMGPLEGVPVAWHRFSDFKERIEEGVVDWALQPRALL